MTASKVEEEDPFSSPSTSLLLPTGAAGSNHKPSLTVLISQTELDELDTRDSMALPVARELSHECFRGEEWNASDFLLERRLVGLDELRSELREYLATLRQSLVAVINEEYESFIGLSLGLRHARISSTLSSIRRPVLSIRGEVGRVKENLEGMRGVMEGVLKERKGVREEKVKLRRWLECEEGMEKVESLLAKEQLNGDDDSHAKRLERISAEYTQMLYLVQRAGSEVPFIQSLQPRIERITEALTSSIDELLVSLLSSLSAPQTRESLAILLRTYASLSLESRAEQLVRETLVDPFLVSVVHRDALTQPPRDSSKPEKPLDPTGPDVTNLTGLYNSILDFLERDVALVLQVGSSVPSSSHPRSSLPLGQSQERAVPPPTGFAYDPLLVLVRPIIASLITNLSSTIFSSGRPSVFHQSYTLSTRFIERLEEKCGSLEGLESFRTCRELEDWERRCRTGVGVYAQLRWGEVVGAIESSLAGSGTPLGSSVESGFRLRESEVCYRAMEGLWGEGVFLDDLAGRWWRITLQIKEEQILSRYRTWLNATVPRTGIQTSASNANLAALGTPPSRNSFDGGSRASRPSTPQPPPSTLSPEENEESALRLLTLLVADSLVMEKKAWSLFEGRIQNRLPSGGEIAEEESLTAAVMRESLTSLTSIVPTLESQIVSLLVKRSAENLKHVRAVANQVRASTRKGPVEPSFFVGSVLKDLRGFLGGPGRAVDEIVKRRWAEEVVGEVASRYATILQTQKKTDDSLLRWAKKGRAGLSFFSRTSTASAEEGGDKSEEDKVKNQMRVDIEAFAKDAEALGVETEKVKGFETLRGVMEERKEVEVRQ